MLPYAKVYHMPATREEFLLVFLNERHASCPLCFFFGPNFLFFFLLNI